MKKPEEDPVEESFEAIAAEKAAAAEAGKLQENSVDLHDRLYCRLYHGL